MSQWKTPNSYGVQVSWLLSMGSSAVWSQLIFLFIPPSPSSSALASEDGELALHQRQIIPSSLPQDVCPSALASCLSGPSVPDSLAWRAGFTACLWPSSSLRRATSSRGFLISVPHASSLLACMLTGFLPLLRRSALCWPLSKFSPEEPSQCEKAAFWIQRVRV